MLEMPMMLPPGGDCWDICSAADWVVRKDPVRFVVRVEDQREGVMLHGH